MNYVSRALPVLEEKLGKATDARGWPSCEPELTRYYLLLMMVKGSDVTNKDVHDAWAVWRNETRPDHKSIVEFDDLSEPVQAMDTPFRDAIRETAAELGI